MHSLYCTSRLRIVCVLPVMTTVTIKTRNTPQYSPTLKVVQAGAGCGQTEKHSQYLRAERDVPVYKTGYLAPSMQSRWAEQVVVHLKLERL